MKQPLLSVVILLVAGIALGRCVELPVWTLLLMGLTASVAAFVVDRLRSGLLPLIVILCGAVNISIQTQIISPVDVRAVVTTAATLATIQGHVLSVTQKAVLEKPAEAPPRFSVQVQLDHIRLDRAPWEQVHGTVLATTEFAGAENIHPGRRIQLFGILDTPPGPFAPGMFDYRRHLANRGIYYQLRSEEPEDLVMLDATRVPWSVGFQKWAMAALGNGFPAEDRSIELLRAMCLGWRTGLTDEVAAPFMQSGTMHLFAISGLHVALIAAILIALLRFVRVSRAWSGLIVIPMLWFFTAATGWQASAIRSTIMMSVMLFAWSLRRPTDLINTLSAAALIILLWDPGQLFQAGFQLSFAVVGTIALSLPLIESWRQKTRTTDPFLAPAFRPAWKQRMEPVLTFGVTASAVSLAAWLGSLPLIMHYFNLFTPVSLLANILVVQLAAGALAAASGCLICALFLPLLSEWFAHSAWFFMTLMHHAGEWFSNLPLAWAYVQAPPPAAIGCYYAGLVISLTAPKWFPQALRTITVAALGMTVAAVLWNQRHGSARVTLLPLRGGLALFVENLHRENWLVDCGDPINYEYRTSAFLKTRGVNRVDNFMVTHGDIRHMGAATNVINEFRPRHVYLNPVDQSAGSHRELVSFIEENRLEFRRVEAGNEIGPWSVLHPAADDDFGKADAGTLVMSLNLGNETILLCGDLNAEGQQTLAGRHPELRADIVIISSNSDHRQVHPAWLAQFNPGTVIVADSLFPASERTTEEYADRLRKVFGSVRIMSEEGTIQLMPPRAEQAGRSQQ